MKHVEILVYVNYILTNAYYQPQHLFKCLETDCLVMTNCPTDYVQCQWIKSEYTQKL